ncbi:Petrobactin import ATP-binding protein FpuD [Oligella sp. MSHR50489EDL]
MIRVQEVTLAYDGHQVIRESSCQIDKGSIVVLIGTNGCSKSTLLRAMARLLPPTKGQVELEGRGIYQFSAKQFALQLAFLP